MRSSGLILTYIKRIGCSVESLAETIQKLVVVCVNNSEIIYRVKDEETLRKKMYHKNTTDLFMIDDIYAIRILVDSVEEAYLVLKKISSAYVGYLDHDYIKTPKECISLLNKGKFFRQIQFIGYKNNVPFEIQITTHEFDSINKSLHEGYKKIYSTFLKNL
ncbi:MAG: hypothetical protein NT161_02225 [Candidatus Nomurabacteria bacterium]|nr:hypothetical protein [Candidatus Nomurabacteria bacterium]